MSFDLGTVTHLIAAVLLLALLLAQVAIWKRGNSSFVLLIATVVTFAWCIVLALASQIPITSYYIVPAFEILKNLSWFLLLLSILGVRKLIIPKFREKEDLRGLAFVSVISFGIPLGLLAYVFYLRFASDVIIFVPELGGRGVLAGFLISAIVGLALLEQVVRNIRFHQVWHLKFLCLSLGILFVYDIYLYSNALLFERIQSQLWQARGAIIALVTPLIAISVLRTRQQPMQLNVSRRLVFHTGILITAGAYLLLMASAGYYIRSFSGEWGLILQVVFWVIALAMLLVLAYSGRLRSVLKLYINRHLFSSKYDYRDEWMRISNTLSRTSADESLQVRVIHALADSVDSPGGSLWLTTDGIHYDQTAHLEMGWIDHSAMADDDYLIKLLKDTDGFVDLNDGVYTLEGNRLPAWLKGLKKAWLLIPLRLHDNLIGIVLLRESRVDFDLNWEDYELMKAASQQAASYLAQMIASDALSEVRQFSAFNQVSAFVVHDLKTLNSQLSLMVKNAETHRDNPAFVDDMIKTTEHAVGKMNFLLKHFQNQDIDDTSKITPFDLLEVCRDVVSSQTALRPLPQFECTEKSIEILGNREELKSSISHLVQNAQEATADDGSIVLKLAINNDHAQLDVEDNGAGMTKEFVNTQLVRPFVSTKGLTGMGIGVYQCRTTIRKLGGNLRIQSEPGRGSVFTITLPLYTQEDDPIGAPPQDVPV